MISCLELFACLLKALVNLLASVLCVVVVAACLYAASQELGSSSKASTVLWALSFLSYSVPAIIDKCLEKLQQAATDILEIQEECCCVSGSTLYTAIGSLLEGSRVSKSRKSFNASDVGAGVFVFDEWIGSWSCTIVLVGETMMFAKNKMFAGAFLGRLLCWCPRVVTIEYNHRSNDNSFFVLHAMRRRDLYRMAHNAKTYLDSYALRPLLTVHARNRTQEPHALLGF